MERLKSIAGLTEPDERNLLFSRITSTGVQPRSLKLIYDTISSVSLHDGVPEDVRHHFLQAQHLAIYAWYYYPFHTTAELLSAVSIEYALKVKSGRKNGGLGQLVRLAVEKGWVTDEGFSFAPPQREGKKRYVEEMMEWLPGLRNSLGHGSSAMGMESYTGVKVAAEFINQLFPVSGSE